MFFSKIHVVQSFSQNKLIMLTCAGKLRKNTVGEDKWKLRNLNLRHVVSVEQVFFIKDD